MSPAPRISPLIAAAWFALNLAPGGHAQTTPSPSTDFGTFPVTEPGKVSPPPPKSERRLSDQMSSTIASGMPKYHPPKTVDSKPGEESSDLRDTDKPKNGIVRLPKYIVNQPKQPKPPVFTEREILTPKGLVELTMKRNPGLHIGNIFGWNEGIALVMYAEQERLNNLADMTDSVRISRDFGDNAGADALALERTRLAYRQSDIGGSSHAPGQ